MNYYNPYFSTIPFNYTPTVSASRGLLGSLFGGGKLSSFINGTQKTLGLVNQAIPIIKQMSPVMKNAKTMFKVMNEFKKVDVNKNSIKSSSNISYNQKSVPDSNETNIINNNTNSNGPTFFL